MAPPRAAQKKIYPYQTALPEMFLASHIICNYKPVLFLHGLGAVVWAAPKLSICSFNEAVRQILAQILRCLEADGRGVGHDGMITMPCGQNRIVTLQGLFIIDAEEFTTTIRGLTRNCTILD